MLSVKENEKLICPYCKGKQAYPAKDYVAPNSGDVHEHQCECCDQNFLVRKVGNEVFVDSNWSATNLLAMVASVF